MSSEEIIAIEAKVKKIKSIIDQFDRIVSKGMFDDINDEMQFKDLMLYRIKQITEKHGD